VVRFLLIGTALAALACAPGGARGQGESIPADAVPLLQAAREDLASQLAVSQEEIETRSVEATNWPDSSLGCPEPERFYAQVITPGYRIVLAANDHEYPYHSSRSQVTACPPERERAGMPLDGAAVQEPIR
jgi:hypothetical protein